jgi:phage FluMu protein Com
MTHVCETCKTTYEAQAVSKFCPPCRELNFLVKRREAHRRHRESVKKRDE